MYRPNLREDIISCKQTCDIFQKIKEGTGRKIAELLYITPFKPNQLITTDLTGPFVSTVRGNKYLMVVIDHFTKFIECYPLKNIKAVAVADKLENEWFCRYGITEGILSDGGKQYQSKLMEIIYDMLDVRKFKTTPFHPQCDGQSERTIQTLKMMIKEYVDVN